MTSADLGMIRRRQAGLQVAANRAADKPWSNAKPTTCSRGHRHASKLEARACAWLHVQFPAALIFQQTRMPLFTLAPKPDGRPHTLCVDFLVVQGGRIECAFDAKGRESRDWSRGAAAFEAAYSLPITILTDKDLPR